MAVGSAAALICDTGALLDYLVESAPDHRLFRSAIDQARTRYVPGSCSQRSIPSFATSGARSCVHAGSCTRRIHVRTAHARSALTEIDRRYADRGLGLVDGSVVAFAEDLGILRLATRDLRHFAAVRLRVGSPFELVVHPTYPDRS